MAAGNLIARACQVHMQEKRRAARPAKHRGRSIGRLSRIRTALAGQRDLVAAGGYLILAGLLGGGLVAWGLAYTPLVIATIMLAALLAWSGGPLFPAGVPRTGQAGLIGVAVVPLLQLVPLPPALWQALPGQSQRITTLTAAGIADSWQPLTLEPASTALCAVLAIGLVALVGFLLRLTDVQFRWMPKIATGLVLAGIVIGLFQVVSDGHPQLKVSNMGATMLGFFANKNHMALAIACSIPFFGLVVSRDFFSRERRRAVVIGYIAFAIVCIVTTNSRAGLFLGAVAGATVLADIGRGVALRWRIAAVAVVGLSLVGLLSTSAFEQVSDRVGEVDSDLRWQFLSWSKPLAERYALSGSGIGSFATLFTANEQLAWVKPTFVNAAHNDYLQLVIEAGVPGVLVLALLIVSVLRCVGTCWSMSRRDPHRMEMIAGFAVLALFALHSGFDYPLRRPAAWIFFALGLAAVYRGRVASKALGRVSDA